jgi:uncharacterized integral membrane protein
VAEPETSQPAPRGDRAPNSGRGSGPGGYSWKAILLAALGIYALLLIIQNSKHVSVSFVFFSQKTRVIYLVLLCMALGALITWLIPRMRHGHDKKKRSSAKGADAKTGRRTGPGGISWKTIMLAALGIYALLLVILNGKTVRLDFVLFSEKTRVIFLVLLSMALGALIVLLARRMRRGRKERPSALPPASPAADDPPASAAGTGEK